MSEFERRMKEATERVERDIAEGIVREPVTAFRFEVEMGVLARKKGLVPPAAKNMFSEHLRSKNITAKEFRALSGQEKLDLLREALAD